MQLAVRDPSFFQESKRALRALCPQSVLNWREANFYGRYGEVELHLLEFLCHPERDSIDVGANDGSYVHFLRRYSRRVYAYEPMPALADTLREKFSGNVIVKTMALSDSSGTAELHSPVVDGVVVTGCSTISNEASATYPGHQAISVPMDRLDTVYDGDVGFIKIDVEGHEQAVLGGAVETIRSSKPRMLVEIDERLSPGGLARARQFFDKLDYKGYFIYKGTLQPIKVFDPGTMQDPGNLPDLTAPLQARERFGRYIYNFIFLPPTESSSTLVKLAERLDAL